MLHLCLFLLVAFWPFNIAWALDTSDSTRFGVLTADQALRLQTTIEARTVRIRRSLQHDPRIRIPGAQFDQARGWLLQSGRVLTAHQFVEGWPVNKNDIVEVYAAGRWIPAAVGWHDKRTGMAVLKTELSSDKPALPVLDAPFRIGSGRLVFGLGLTGRVEGFQVGAKGVEAYGYYLTVIGQTELGTPLTDARGRLLTIIGLRPTTATKTTYALPLDALKWLLKNRTSWSK